MKNVQTIKFDDFMKGTWREEEVRRSNFTMIPVPSISSMFLNEPVMMIFGAGVVLMGLAIYERRLVSKGKDTEAEMIATVTHIGLAGIGIAGALFVLAKAGGALL